MSKTVVKFLRGEILARPKFVREGLDAVEISDEM
jgi:hypothetical protein